MKGIARGGAEGCLAFRGAGGQETVIVPSRDWSSCGWGIFRVADWIAGLETGAGAPHGGHSAEGSGSPELIRHTCRPT